jgi:hypothetical protein
VPLPDTPTPTHTATSTATPTSTPTSTPTPTPTPTHTQTPPPVVDFWADDTTIVAGTSTFLHWHVEHVLEIYLDGSPVTGPDGQREVNPAVTTTYELRAIHGGGEETRLVTITVVPGEVTVTLTGQGNLDGYVIGGMGSYNNQDIRVGNYGTASGENVYRGFLSFDLSGIPAGANVQSIQLRFFQVDVVGDPYGKLDRPLIPRRSIRLGFRHIPCPGSGTRSRPIRSGPGSRTTSLRAGPDCRCVCSSNPRRMMVSRLTMLDLNQGTTLSGPAICPN